MSILELSAILPPAGGGGGRTGGSARMPCGGRGEPSGRAPSRSLATVEFEPTRERLKAMLVLCRCHAGHVRSSPRARARSLAGGEVVPRRRVERAANVMHARLLSHCAGSLLQLA